MSLQSNDDKHLSSEQACEEEEEEEEAGYDDEEEEEEIGDAVVWDIGEEESCTPCPYPVEDMGVFKLHPRLRSLALLSPLNDSSDPVNEHLIITEKILRERILIPPKMPVWFKYIENAQLETEFLLKKGEHSEAVCMEEVFLFYGTTSKYLTNDCSTNIRVHKRFSETVRVQGHSMESEGGRFFSRYPNRILRYTNELILCRALLGPNNKSVEDREHLKDFSSMKELYDKKDFSSIEIAPKNPYWNEILVSSRNQILPYCIISVDDSEIQQKMRSVSKIKKIKSKNQKSEKKCVKMRSDQEMEKPAEWATWIGEASQLPFPFQRLFGHPVEALNDERLKNPSIPNIPVNLENQSTTGPFSDAEYPELIQVGCKKNGTPIFINRRGELLVDGTISSIQVPGHETKIWN